MAGFKEGALQLKKKDSLAPSDIGTMKVLVNSNGQVYTVNELGVSALIQGGGTDDHKVLSTSADTLPGTLIEKITPGTNVYISATGPTTSANIEIGTLGKLATISNDTQAYLQNKLVPGTGTIFETITDATYGKQIKISLDGSGNSNIDWPVITNVPVASTSTSGVLTSANWNTFNNKQSALNSSSNLSIANLSASSVSATSVSASNVVVGNLSANTLYEGGQLLSARYLPLSGGTMTGSVKFSASNYTISDTSAATTHSFDIGKTVDFVSTGKTGTATFVDQRDGTIYPCVLMPDGKWWSAKNLSWAGAGVAYNNDPGLMLIYGGLYNWIEANASCPMGTHLPSDSEWTYLENLIPAPDGTKLKASSPLWYTNTGTDVYGFSALPGGQRTASPTFAFAFLNSEAYFQTATSYDTTRSYKRSLDKGSPSISPGTQDKTISASVRFIVDDTTKLIPSTSTTLSITTSAIIPSVSITPSTSGINLGTSASPFNTTYSNNYVDSTYSGSSYVLVSTSAKSLVESSLSASQLTHLSTISANVQDQLNAKMTGTFTNGDNYCVPVFLSAGGFQNSSSYIVGANKEKFVMTDKTQAVTTDYHSPGIGFQAGINSGTPIAPMGWFFNSDPSNAVKLFQGYWGNGNGYTGGVDWTRNTLKITSAGVLSLPYGYSGTSGLMAFVDSNGTVGKYTLTSADLPSSYLDNTYLPLSGGTMRGLLKTPLLSANSISATTLSFGSSEHVYDLSTTISAGYVGIVSYNGGMYDRTISFKNSPTTSTLDLKNEQVTINVGSGMYNYRPIIQYTELSDTLSFGINTSFVSLTSISALSLSSKSVTLTATDSFEIYSPLVKIASSLSVAANVSATKFYGRFYTTGGDTTQVVLGDGSLASISSLHTNTSACVLKAGSTMDDGAIIISRGSGAGGLITTYKNGAYPTDLKSSYLGAGILGFGYNQSISQYAFFVGTDSSGYVKAGDWRFDSLSVGGVSVLTSNTLTGYLPTSGGAMTGLLNATTLSANSISATTYYEGGVALSSKYVLATTTRWTSAIPVVVGSQTISASHNLNYQYSSVRCFNTTTNETIFLDPQYSISTSNIMVFTFNSSSSYSMTMIIEK